MATNKLLTFVAVLVFTLHPGHGGFQVIQPHYQTVNADGTASITCEHTANVSTIEDVRLNSLPLTGQLSRMLLCQKGMEACDAIVLHEDSPNRCLFIILHAGPPAMSVRYECEFTIKVDEVDFTQQGTPTILIAAGEEKACGQPPPCPARSDLLLWIVIGLLALLALYSCAITIAHFGQKDQGPENSVYVEMRKTSPPTHNRGS